MGIKHIVCQGTPYEIGLTHGQNAEPEIKGSIDFYAGLFMQNSKKTWPEVRETAKAFEDLISGKWPRYYEEFKGVADGAELDILDIIALNVRTEIAFGLFSDGCTSVYWRDANNTFQGQNWDWMLPQKSNLLHLTLHATGLPSIQMITEAGIIGKIGLNCCGVGVCFNAIRARGVNLTHLPVHLGLRMALESHSAMEAVENIENVGMASSAHILIGDRDHAVGLEFTSETFARLGFDDFKGKRPGNDNISNGSPPNSSSSSYDTIIHTNHLLLPHSHSSPPPKPWLSDSPTRLSTMQHNLSILQTPESSSSQLSKFKSLFTDQTNYPTSICRKQIHGKSTAETLFNIVMDLRCDSGERPRATVWIGRPVREEEEEEEGEGFEMGF